MLLKVSVCLAEQRSVGMQVEHAVRRQMDNEVGPDQLVVVLDAQGASALQVTRKAQLCKDTAVILNKVPLVLWRHDLRVLRKLLSQQRVLLLFCPTAVD